MTRYRLSPAAEADLEAIWEFTATQWNRDQAETYIRMIKERLLGLVEGRIPPRSAGEARAGYFKCAAGSHMIYFRRETDEIIVVRILHQSMDVDRRLPD